MTKFLGKVILAFIIFSFINLLMNNVIPTYWGNEVIYKKMNQALLEQSKITTLFIGTSRVHSGLNPIKFDQVAKNTHSFNIASPGALGFETLRIVEGIIEENIFSNLEHIYIEIPAFKTPKIENENSVRGNYFYNLRAFFFHLRFSSFRNITAQKKMSEILYSCRLLIKNTLGIGHLKTQVKVLIEQLTKHTTYEKSKKRGFGGIKGQTKNKSEINQRLRMARQFFDGSIDDIQENEFLSKQLNKTIEFAKNRDIEIVYILMPKNPYGQYVNKYKSLSQLETKNKLNFANPNKNPRFYNIKLSPDKSHLNLEGAQLMTKKVAEHHNKYF